MPGPRGPQELVEPPTYYTEPLRGDKGEKGNDGEEGLRGFKGMAGDMGEPVSQF